MVTDELKLEESADTTMLEAVKTEEKMEKVDSHLPTKDIETTSTASVSTMPPPPSPNIWNEYKTSILNLDPDNPIFLLPIDTLSDLEISSLFPDLPLYEPPQPNDTDAYIDELEHGRVIPITKFISEKIVIKRKTPPSRKRTSEEAFSDTDEQQEDVPLLPKHDKYDSTQYLSRKMKLAIRSAIMVYHILTFSPPSIVCTSKSQRHTCHSATHTTTTKSSHQQAPRCVV